MTPGEEDLADKLADLSVTRGTQPELDEAHDTAASAAPTQGAGSPRAADEAGSERPAGVGSDSRKLFVGGLPQLAIEELVLSVFESYGTVEEVHMIKPNPTSESKRGCCFVTYATAAEAEAAIAALNSCVCSELNSLMPLLVRVADPPRSRDEQRSRSAAQHAQQRGMAAQMGVLPSWGGALGYGWPPQQQGAYAAGQPPFYLAQHGAAAAASGAAAAQYMGVFPGAYGFGMLPQFAAQVGDWSEHADGDGNKYYYNSQTGVSQWEPPSHWQAQQAQQQQQQLPIMYPYAQPLPGYFAQPSPNGAGVGGSLLAGGVVDAPGVSTGTRGPKGSNLAIFCIPNSYTDLDLHEIARPYGNVVYAQVSRHRDTGLSRGYGFVSFSTVAEAEQAINGIHGTVVLGRALRVEKVKADDEQQQAR